MKPPEFLLNWFRRMPYHQIAELTVWMDAQPDLSKSIEEGISLSLESSCETLETLIDCPFDTIDWGTVEPWFDLTDTGNQGS